MPMRLVPGGEASGRGGGGGGGGAWSGGAGGSSLGDKLWKEVRHLREVRPGTSPVLAGEPFARKAELFVSAPAGWGGGAGSAGTVGRCRLTAHRPRLFQRLKLKCDAWLSNFNLNFYLRLYSTVLRYGAPAAASAELEKRVAARTITCCPPNHR
jgi:hypothetical protein